MKNGLSALILKTDKDSVEVIDENQHLQTIPYLGIERKINDRNVFARNTMNQNIGLESNIKVKDGIQKVYLSHSGENRSC